MAEALEVPEGWTAIDVDDVIQTLEGYQRRRDGLVVVLEEHTLTGERYAVAALPQNFREDNQVIRSIGDNGYLGQGDDLDEVRETAFDWMEENPR